MEGDQDLTVGSGHPLDRRVFWAGANGAPRHIVFGMASPDHGWAVRFADERGLVLADTNAALLACGFDA